MPFATRSDDGLPGVVTEHLGDDARVAGVSAHTHRHLRSLVVQAVIAAVRFGRRRC
jgi:hypothetical protein